MAGPPRDPTFDALRRQAKRWLRALRDGDEEARRRLARALPRHSHPPRLREVQQALARERGFASWAVLKEHLALEGDDPADRLAVFLEHACIFTPPVDFPSKWRRAERIRARHPEIATATIHAAVVCGEVEHVRALLEADPTRVASRGGPQQWEPLLFACYGRLPNEQARVRGLEMATLLLDAGADPNAHFVTADDWHLRFNALTGVMGQGEMGQPEHPHADALARLLLERGADPNDSQGLYDTHLVGDDTRWLELLFEHGLGPDDPIRWHADPADAVRSGADRCPAILDYLVAGAAANGHRRRLALLLERGADPNARSIYDGRTCYELARIRADREAVELLLGHGAAPSELDGHDAFVAAARAGDRGTAERWLRQHPEFRRVGDPLTEAARQGEAEVVRRLLELGVDPDAESKHGHRALHNACLDRTISLLLLRHGADPRARVFGGTACQWAENGGDLEMARFHAEHSRSLLDAVRSGHLALARALLLEDPARVGETSPEGNGPLHELPGDVDLAEPLIAELLARGADPRAKNREGRTPAEQLDARGLDEVADALEAEAAERPADGGSPGSGPPEGAQSRRR